MTGTRSLIVASRHEACLSRSGLVIAALRRPRRISRPPAIPAVVSVKGRKGVRMGTRREEVALKAEV